MKLIKELPQWSLFLIISVSSLFLLYPLGSVFVPLIAIVVVSFIAFGLALYLHDGTWWKWIHLFFLPLIVLFFQFNIAPQWYLLALFLSWLIFGKVMVS
ncbi:MAG: hypothetical protein ACRC01_07205, partial [Deefgea sp.]